MLGYITVGSHAHSEEVDWDRFTVLIENGARLRWTKVAEATHGLETSSPGNTQPRQTAPILDHSRRLPQLPNEMIEQILVSAAGNFDHQAVVTTTPFSRNRPLPDEPQSTQMRLGVYKRRDWKDILMFQLSRDFRATAVRLFGSPRRDGFPFNPNTDTLTINIDEEGTFYTGCPAVSSLIPTAVREITLKPLDRPICVIDYEMLQIFGEGDSKIRGILEYICRRQLQTTRTFVDGILLSQREPVSVSDLAELIKKSQKLSVQTFHKLLETSPDLARLF